MGTRAMRIVERTRLIGPAAMLLLAMAGGGCTGARWMAYSMAPDIKEKISAECRLLYGQTVAVVVATNLMIDHDNPGLALDLSMKIAQELGQNVPKCRVVDALKIVNFQSANYGWRDMPKDQLAERLGANYVLLVTVNAFSTVDPMTRELSRGVMEAEAALYSASRTALSPQVWQATGGLRAAYPSSQNTEGNITQEGPEKVRMELVNRFSVRLAKKFYDHHEPVERRDELR
ncbi:MAG: hypothetical protein NTV86_08235 [Planctomycetota bacterium]|nr:hypothetical protein [Planctomycetota bacterium]